MTYLFGYYSALNMDPVPQGISHQGIVPYQKFDTSDDPIIVAVANDNIWRKFCKAIGRDDLINNPKFKDNKSRVENRTELISILQKIFYSKGSAEWLNIFKEYEIPSSKLNKISDIVNSNFVRESEAIVMKDVGGKTFYFPAFPAIVNGKYLPFYKTNPPRLCQG